MHSMRSGAASMPRVRPSSESADERAVRSLARLRRCWASASAALRVTVSASARLSPRCGTRSETREPRSADSQFGTSSASAGSAGTRISRGTAVAPSSAARPP